MAGTGESIVPALMRAMASYQLCRGVSIAAFDDCVIALDVRADRYWRFDGRAAYSLQAIAARAVPDADALAKLLSLRLIEPASGPPVQCDAIRLPPVTASASEAAGGDAERFAPVTAVRVVWSLVIARFRLRFFTFEALLDEIGRRRRGPDGLTSGELQVLAVTFKRYRRLLPFAFRCLPDSLAFLSFVARRGLHPYLVIGVEAYPFAAHCWVQANNVVLNDAVDHAAVFQPIRVV